MNLKSYGSKGYGPHTGYILYIPDPTKIFSILRSFFLLPQEPSKTDPLESIIARKEED